MKPRPTPEDFGVTDADIFQVKEQDARAARLEGRVDLIAGLLICGSFVWPGQVLVRLPLNENYQLIQLILYFSMVVLQIFGVVFASTKLKRWLVHLHPKSEPVHRYHQSVAAFEDWWVRTNATYWQRLSGRRFELELARLFNAIGWEAKATRASGDGGVDIEATIDGASVIVQCKAHGRPVGPGAVRELYGTLMASKANLAMLASISGFGPGAHEFVALKPITLIDLPWIIEKQRSLDFERMPIAIGRNEVARRIRRVNPIPATRRRRRY
jgi:hypothetical protein